MNRIRSLDTKNDSLSYIVNSIHLKVLNGGMPPKFYLKYGADINSIEGEDIVFIEMNKIDTIVYQVFMSSKTKNKVHISTIDYFAGDTMRMDFVAGHISIWK